MDEAGFSLASIDDEVHDAVLSFWPRWVPAQALGVEPPVVGAEVVRERVFDLDVVVGTPNVHPVEQSVDLLVLFEVVSRVEVALHSAILIKPFVVDRDAQHLLEDSDGVEVGPVDHLAIRLGEVTKSLSSVLSAGQSGPGGVRDVGRNVELSAFVSMLRLFEVFKEIVLPEGEVKVDDSVSSELYRLDVVRLIGLTTSARAGCGQCSHHAQRTQDAGAHLGTQGCEWQMQPSWVEYIDMPLSPQASTQA